MEKRNWLWKRKSSEKSPGGETESSGSISSHSERYSDEQEALKGSPNHSTQSPEVTSKVAILNEEVNDTVKSLTQKLSAALVNVGAKEDLVKQHAKVAEEAVAGWEKAENESVVLKQELEATVQQNLALEVRVSHLEGALKECVRQLRQAKDEHEQRAQEALSEKTHEWESAKAKLESQLHELQTRAESRKSENTPLIDPKILFKLESLEKENSTLKLELMAQAEELEIRTIEMELSTQAAETASKQHLESIKKVAKLEAECRRLQAASRKPPSINDHKSVSASSLYVESLTDSQSDSGDRLNSVEPNKPEQNGCDPSISDSWASALIAELGQFKTQKGSTKNLPSCSVEINLMDDFLEMERLASLPEIESKTRSVESEGVNVESSLRPELEAMSHRVAELEDKLEKIEEEKAKLAMALNASQDSLEASRGQLAETVYRLEELQKELAMVNESKELLEFQLMGMEVEARTMSAKVDSVTSEVDSLKSEVEKERSLSTDLAVRCKELEGELLRRNGEFEAELTRKSEEVLEIQQSAISNGDLKVKQEDLAVAAGKLAECQQTIASLGRQLKSLATLEDFLIDTANLPAFSEKESTIPKSGSELWKLHSNDTFMSKSDQDSSKLKVENSSPSSNCSSLQLNHMGSSTKSKNGFGKLFSRSKSGVQPENHQG
ncbi:hypothetical protein LguiB_009955 [Lonicera macranthoides]